LELKLILKNKEIGKNIPTELQKINPDISIKYHVISFIEDIWIRDWAPFLCADELDNTVAAKMLYNPSYYKKYEKIFAEHDNQAGYDIANYLGYELIDFPAIWDGGNLTHNGKGAAIFTSKLLSDNGHISTGINIFKIFSKIGINKFYTTDIEPGDVTGHIDGMVRFVREDTLVIGAYPEKYYCGNNEISEKDFKKSRKFMNKVAEQFEGIFKIERITNSIPKNEEKEGIPSAFGNYINFLRLDEKVFLPQFGGREDEAAYNTFVDIFGSENVIKVNSCIKDLASFGGVLNCFSWVAF